MNAARKSDIRTAFFCMIFVEVLSLQTVFQHGIDGHHVTDGSGQYKEVEDRMEIFPLVNGIEDGSGNVADPFSHYPEDALERNGFQQRLECNDDEQAHDHIADGFHMADFLHLAETQAGADQGAEPDDPEDGPSPGAGMSHCDECDGRIASGNVPVDGCMVKFAEPRLVDGIGRTGMIAGRGDVGKEHAHQVEDNACFSDPVRQRKIPDDEERSDSYAQYDAQSMG